jgi:hypothetical protein
MSKEILAQQVASTAETRQPLTLEQIRARVPRRQATNDPELRSSSPAQLVAQESEMLRHPAFTTAATKVSSHRG